MEGISMRARWLKPEFFTDKKIASLGPIVALVYEALWCMADDGGTAPCDADTVKAQMFYRWSAVGVPEISGALTELSCAGMIVRYTVGDDTFCAIKSWKKHQQVHKPSKFRHPPMSQGVAVAVPEECRTVPAPLPASPPPRHLDTQTPRHPAKGAEPAPRTITVKKPRPAMPWMGRMREAWTLGDLLPGDATLLAPIVGAVGEDETVERLTNYCATADPEWASVRAFVSKHATHATKGRLAVDPETGLPNALGMAALSGRR
jgi:hypothetical protein